MKHIGTKRLETERLILRRFNENDYHDMYKNWASEKLVARFMPWHHHENEEVTKNIVNMWINEYQNDTCYNWVIELKKTNEIIGTITVVNEWNENDCCEIGYAIGTKYWGNEYVKEALLKVIDFLFNEVGYHRIEAKHAINNPNSGRVMEKCGMVYEGTLKDKAKILKEARWNKNMLPMEE